MDNASRPVLFFDGVCNLCNGVVQFVLKHDKKALFLFAPLQSVVGQEALKKVPEAGEATGSFILFYNNAYYTHSSAALDMFRLLGGGWQLLSVGIIIPRFIRDAVYKFISRNRYRWFGRTESCMVPAPGVMDRFLG